MCWKSYYVQVFNFTWKNYDNLKIYKVSFVLQNPFKDHRSKKHWWFLANTFIIPVKENAGNESKYAISGKKLAYSIP